MPFVPVLFGLVALGILFGPSAYAASKTKTPNCAYGLKGPAVAVIDGVLVFLNAECAEEIWDQQVESDSNPLRALAFWAVILKSQGLVPGDGLRLPEPSEFASRAHMLAFMMLWERMIKARGEIGRVAEEGGPSDWQGALAIYGTSPEEVASLPVVVSG